MRVVNPNTVAQAGAAGVIALLAAFGAAQAPDAPTTDDDTATSTAVLGALTARATAPSVADTTGAPASEPEVEVSSTVVTRSSTTATDATSTTGSTTSTTSTTTAPSTETSVAVETTATPTTTTSPPLPTEPVAAAATPSPTLLEATSTSRAVSDHERRGTAALARIGYDWTNRLPGWTIEFLPGRSGLIGLTYTHERRIEIYVRDSLSDDLLTHVIAHELGHAVDLTHNSGADREAWQQARGITGSPWWPGNGTTDFSTGAGDFAEAFAEWQVGRGLHRSRIGGGPPTAAQYDLLSDLAG